MQIKKQVSQFMWDKDGMSTDKFFVTLIGGVTIGTFVTMVSILMMVSS